MNVYQSLAPIPLISQTNYTKVKGREKRWMRLDGSGMKTRLIKYRKKKKKNKKKKEKRKKKKEKEII
jgi:hypothetical protein